MNQLRQIALAALNYESAYQYFPSAGDHSQGFDAAGTQNRTAVDRENWGWGYQVLPFMEQNNLYAMREVDGSNGSPGRMLSQVVPTYNCPSRGDRRGVQSWGADFFLGDYAGVMTSWNFGGSYSAGWGGFNWQDQMATQPEAQTIWRGIIAKTFNSYLDSGVRVYQNFGKVGFGAVTDGSSNTFMIGEKSVDARRYSPPANGWDWGNYPEPCTALTGQRCVDSINRLVVLSCGLIAFLKTDVVVIPITLSIRSVRLTLEQLTSQLATVRFKQFRTTSTGSLLIRSVVVLMVQFTT
jgi:hypothetical protein